ncbi:hypothetical protein [Streptomyces sp. NPDC005385]
MDDDTADLLREALRVDGHGSGTDVDLSAVTFLDSSGIHVLFAAHRAIG